MLGSIIIGTSVAVLTGVLSKGISNILVNIKEIKKHFDLCKIATMLTAKEQLYSLHEKYVIERKSITASELSRFTDIYINYHDLGGNGEGTLLMKDVSELYECSRRE